MTLAPIALFAYNRLVHTRRTVEALQKNELAAQSELYVFSDGPKAAIDEPEVEGVRNYLKDIAGFKSSTINRQPRNLGLAQSIIAGVTEVCQRHGRVIVVEDDLVTAPFFLRYMNEALALYENDPEVISIHGYVYPVKAVLPETFFLKGADCWGWATWQRGWKLFNPDGRRLLDELEKKNLTTEFDFNGNYAYTEMLRQQIAGKNNSWAIRWYASAFLENRLTLYPGHSLVQNIGHDSSGANCGASTAFDVGLADRPIQINRLPLVEHPLGRREFEYYFQSLRRPSLARRVRKLFSRSEVR